MSTKKTKEEKISIIFLILILAFAFMYFKVYLTKSKIYWYSETKNQGIAVLKGIKRLIIRK